MENRALRRRQATRKKLAALDEAARRPLIETDLYRLVQALDEQAVPEDQGMVARTLAHLMRSGRLRWLKVHPPQLGHGEG